MRILLHEYGGHAFVIGLSRALAERGHEVVHVSSGWVQTPQGVLERRDTDPEGLTFRTIGLGGRVEKYSLLQRYLANREHARQLVSLVREYGPDVVISSTTPSDVQMCLVRHCRRAGIKVITWVQDLYGLAAHRLLRRKLPLVGSIIGRYYMALDRRACELSDEVLLITEQFRAHLPNSRVSNRQLVFPNWAPIADLPLRAKQNAWSRRHGLHDRFCFVYSGTLAMKHNPRLLLALAEAHRHNTDVRVVVVSSGRGADWLRAAAVDKGLDNLVVVPCQPFEQMPLVFASADVLVSVLDPDASVFSVPSKVLSYLCAGRPSLLAVPEDNLAAQVIRKAGAGVVAAPQDVDAFIAASHCLYRDPDLRRRLGGQGRQYAERHFDIDVIAERFNAILGNAVAECPTPDVEAEFSTV